MTVERVTRRRRGRQGLAVCLAAVLAGAVAVWGLDLSVQGNPVLVQKDKGKDKGKEKEKEKDKGKPEEKKPRPKTIPEATFKGHADWINRLAVSADGTLLATASRDGTVKIWDLNTVKEIQTLKEEPEKAKDKGKDKDKQPPAPRPNIKAVAFSPDGTRVATNAGRYDGKKKEWEGEIKIWDVKSGKPVASLRGHSEAIEAVAFSPDGKKLASASEDRTVNVFDVASGKLEQTLKGHTAPVWCVAFDRDGKKLASGSAESRDDKGKDRPPEVKVWDLASGKDVLTLKGPERSVSTVAYSPDGTRLAVGGLDGQVLVFDAAGKEALKLKSPEGVWAVAFTRDGKLLAGVGWEETIHVWTADGKERVAINGHKGTVTGVAFSPDGQRLITVGNDGAINVWSTDPAKQKVEKIEPKEKKDDKEGKDKKGG
jgi:WD40 repeat protein